MSAPPVVELAVTALRTARARSRGLMLAVTLGAGLVVATVVLGTTMQQQVEAGAGVEFTRADLLVRSQQGVEAGVDAGASGGAGISVEDAARIAQLPGVAASTAIVRAQSAVAVDGQVLGSLIESVPTAGFAWQRLSEGRLPRSGAEVALSRESLDELGIGVGDSVALGNPTVGRATFSVVGAVDVRGSLRYSSLIYGLVTEPVARSLAGVTGFNEVQVRLTPGVPPQDVIDEVNATVPVGFPLLATDATRATADLYGAGLGVLAGLLTGFALVSAVVAAVVLATVVSASLPARRRQSALLRAVGATRAQVGGALALEMGVLALVGGAVAVPFGIAVATVALPLVGRIPGVPHLSADLLDVPVATVAVVPVAAMLLGAVAAALPAWQVARVSAAEALRDSRGTAPGSAGPRRWATPAVAVMALAALFAAAASGRTLLTALAGLATAVAWIAATPTLCRATATLAGRFASRGHPVAELAAAQVRRFPGRVAATGLAATLAASILSLSWVVTASIDATLADREGQDPGPDVMVGAYAGGPVLPAEAAAELARVDGVAQVLPIGSAPAQVRGRAPEGALGASLSDGAVTRLSGNITALRAADLARVTGGRFPLTRVRPGVAYLPRSDIPPFADDSTVTLIGPEGRRLPLRVSYVEDLPFQVLVAPATLRAVGAEGDPVAVWLGLEREVDRPAVLDDLRAVAVLAGGLPVSGSAPAQARVDQAIDLARGLSTGMLVVSVLIAVLGAALTVSTSVRERVAELASLRLLGMDAADVRRLVATETWVMSALSVGAGLVLGSVLAVAAVVASARALDLPVHLVVPVVPLLLLGLLQTVAVRIAVTGPLDRVSVISPVGALRAATGGRS